MQLDGRIGDDAYVFVESFEDGRIWIDLYGSTVGAAIEWAESRARELGGARLFAGGWSTEREKLDELETRGYILFAARSAWRSS